MDMGYGKRPPDALATVNGFVVASSGQTIAPAYPGADLSTYLCARIARELVSRAIGADPVALAGRARGARKLAYARALSMHLVHIVAGRSQEDVARAFRRNRATASHHFEKVEDLRDCGPYDAFLELLGQHFGLMLALASLPPIRKTWRDALAALDHAAFEGGLEGDAVRSAEYVVATFKAEGSRNGASPDHECAA